MANAPQRSKPHSVDDQLLTVQEVAAVLRLDPYTVRRWVGRGQLPATRVGQQLRISRAAVDSYLAAQAVTVLDDRAAR